MRRDITIGRHRPASLTGSIARSAVHTALPPHSDIILKLLQKIRQAETRRLLLFQSAFFLINVGARCNQLAVAWWSLRVTKSAVVFSSMVAVAATAEVASRLILGSIGDRYNKVLVVMYCNAISAVSCALICAAAFMNAFNALYVCVLMAMSGIVLGVRDPIQTSIIPSLVKSDQVPDALASKAMLYSCATLIGPPVAGLLLSTFHESIAMLANLVCISGASLLIRAVLNPLHFQTTNINNKKFGLTSAFSGLVLLNRIKAEKFMAFFAMGANFAIYPFFTVLMPFYAQHEAHLPPWLLGLIDAAFAGGIFIGSSWLVKACNRRIRRDHSVALGFLLLAANLATVAYGRLIPVMIAGFVAGGIGLMLININTSTVRTLATPPSYRTQMSSVVSFLAGAVNPIACVIVGSLVGNVGLHETVGLLSVFTVAAAAAIPFVPEIARFMRMTNNDLPGAYENAYPNAFSTERTGKSAQ